MSKRDSKDIPGSDKAIDTFIALNNDPEMRAMAIEQEKLLQNQCIEWYIRPLEKRDVPILVSSFAEVDWHKPESLFLTYLDEQEKGQRKAWIAASDELCLGYVTLKYESDYPHFRQNRIPEIMDLNVLPQYRRHGIGSALLDEAEYAAQ